MTTTCPSCHAPQDEGLLCANCTLRLEHELGDVPAIVAELDVTLSRQARIGGGGKSGKGGAHEKNPIHTGALTVAGDLANTLVTWARDVSNETWWPCEEDMAVQGGRTKAAAWLLLSEMPSIRKHPAASEIVDEIADAVAQARNAVDRPANRTIIFVGPCPEDDDEDVACPGEVHAFIPTEDERPPRMQCTADEAHRWTSVQWLRTGKRILDRMNRRQGAA